MRTSFFLTILVCVIASCGKNSTSKHVAGSSEMIRNQVLTLAENYAGSQCKEPRKAIGDGGAISISDSQKRYLIEPLKIFLGPIDDDPNLDAIVTISTFNGQFQTTNEHLIILDSAGTYVLAKVIRSDMEILFVKNKIITADVPTHSRNSPLFNCSECRDVINYQFKEGELIQME